MDSGAVMKWQEPSMGEPTPAAGPASEPPPRSRSVRGLRPVVRLANYAVAIVGLFLVALAAAVLVVGT